MKIIEMFKNLFKKGKKLTDDIKKRVDDFVEYNKPHIQVLMKVLQFMYKKGYGSAKMENVVLTVCGALSENKANSDTFTKEFMNYVENLCQKIYDDLKSNGGLDF